MSKEKKCKEVAFDYSKSHDSVYFSYRERYQEALLHTFHIVKDTVWAQERMSLGLEYAKSIYVRLIGDIFHL
jgi:hypothetical protein